MNEGSARWKCQCGDGELNCNHMKRSTEYFQSRNRKKTTTKDSKQSYIHTNKDESNAAVT